MHPADIKAAIAKSGHTQKSLEEKLGLKRADLTLVLTRRRPSVELALSGFLGIDLHTLWPDRYLPNNVRINPRNADFDRAQYKADSCHKTNPKAAAG